MSSSNEPSLSEQRYILQQQLRSHRLHIIEQFRLDEDPASHFPRSATMRLLCGKTGTKFLTKVILRKLGVGYASAIVNAYSLVRLLVNKKSEQKIG
jgi:hypothetical protein